MWRIAGVMLTDKYPRKGRETCPSAALGFCNSSVSALVESHFKAASEMHFGSFNFMSHGIDGVLLIKQNISFILLISR